MSFLVVFTLLDKSFLTSRPATELPFKQTSFAFVIFSSDCRTFTTPYTGTTSLYTKLAIQPKNKWWSSSIRDCTVSPTLMLSCWWSSSCWNCFTSSPRFPWQGLIFACLVGVSGKRFLSACRITTLAANCGVMWEEWLRRKKPTKCGKNFQHFSLLFCFQNGC